MEYFFTLNFIEPHVEKKIIEGKIGKNKSKLASKLPGRLGLQLIVASVPQIYQ